jgi:nucleoid DNA-binding protein
MRTSVQHKIDVDWVGPYIKHEPLLDDPPKIQLPSLSIGGTLKTKKEIVKTIADEIGLTQLKTKEIVQKTFDAIIDALVSDGRIELRNFGIFEVKKRSARRGRNPKTGDQVEVPEKLVVTFKPGKQMEQRVQQLQVPTLKQAMAEAAKLQREKEAAGQNPPTSTPPKPGASTGIPAPNIAPKDDSIKGTSRPSNEVDRP